MKAQAIKEGYDKLERRISKMKWDYYMALCNQTDTGEVIPEELEQKRELYLNIENDMAKNEMELYREGHRINKASYARRSRLEKKITNMLENNNCIFLTFTFKDSVLDSTTKETRKKYILRALKLISDNYIANIDYGRKNEREHYHAVVVSDNVDRNIWKDYGAINFERIKQTSDSVKLAKYIVKLTNHAIKETVHQNRVIYSR